MGHRAQRPAGFGLSGRHRRTAVQRMPMGTQRSVFASTCLAPTPQRPHGFASDQSCAAPVENLIEHADGFFLGQFEPGLASSSDEPWWNQPGYSDTGAEASTHFVADLPQQHPVADFNAWYHTPDSSFAHTGTQFDDRSWTTMQPSDFLDFDFSSGLSALPTSASHHTAPYSQSLSTIPEASPNDSAMVVEPASSSLDIAPTHEWSEPAEVVSPLARLTHQFQDYSPYHAFGEPTTSAFMAVQASTSIYPTSTSTSASNVQSSGRSQYCLWPGCPRSEHKFGRPDEMDRHKAKAHVPRLSLSGMCPMSSCGQTGFDIYRGYRQFKEHVKTYHHDSHYVLKRGLKTVSGDTPRQVKDFISQNEYDVLKMYVGEPPSSTASTRTSATSSRRSSNQSTSSWGRPVLAQPLTQHLVGPRVTRRPRTSGHLVDIRGRM